MPMFMRSSDDEKENSFSIESILSIVAFCIFWGIHLFLFRISSATPTSHAHPRIHTSLLPFAASTALFRFYEPRGVWRDRSKLYAFRSTFYQQNSFFYLLKISSFSLRGERMRERVKREEGKKMKKREKILNNPATKFTKKLNQKTTD